MKTTLKRLTRFAAASLVALAAIGAVVSLMPDQLRAQVPSFLAPYLQRSTYSSVAVNLAVPQTAAGDAVCLAGSATKLVRVKEIEISGYDTTAQTATTELVVRSTANAGGTSTATTVVANDATNVAATAVMRAYTAVPTTPGTSAGVVAAALLGYPVTSGASAAIWKLTWNPDNLTQEILLRGVAQGLCVTYPGVFSTAGPVINVKYVWTEQ